MRTAIALIIAQNLILLPLAGWAMRQRYLALRNADSLLEARAAIAFAVGQSWCGARRFLYLWQAGQLHLTDSMLGEQWQHFRKEFSDRSPEVA